MEALLLLRKNSGVPVLLVVGGSGPVPLVVGPSTVLEVRGDAVQLLAGGVTPVIIPYANILFIV
ncbi:MAG: hypothetical protein FH756_14495 [Firmicutes bacterium]|nr:hypothetical protein [Bacillota bacterium]